MEILKAFIINESTHDIRIVKKDNTAFFCAKDVGIVLGLTNVRMTMASLDDDEKVTLTTDGGPLGPRNSTYLTQQGMYRILMRSRKPIAKPFQKWICSVIDEIGRCGKYELEKDIELKVQGLAEDRVQELIRNIVEEKKKEFSHKLLKETNNILKNIFTKYHIIYFGLVEALESGELIIKIGSTAGIKNREAALKSDFGKEFVFLKVFKCHDEGRFENYMHTHPDIKKLKYSMPGNNSTELYKFTEKDLKHAYNIAVQNTHKFCGMSPDQEFEIKRQELVNKGIELANKSKELELKKLAITGDSDNSENGNDDDSYETKEDDVDDGGALPEALIIQHFKKRKQSRGDKVQRYSPEGELMETYEGTTDALRKFEGASISALKSAIKKRSIYRHFRWINLPRDKPDDTFQDIGETVEQKEVNLGLIAFLSLRKDRIERVFPDQKSAQEFCMFKSPAAISNAIKKGTRTSGHFVMHYNDCDEELKQDFLSRETLPEPTRRSNGRSIHQLHPITKCVVRTYKAMTDVFRQFPMSRLSLMQAIELKEPIRNYYWAYAD